MERVKILHTGDLHLGASFAHSRLPGQIGKIRRQELWETFNRIIETVKREDVQLLLIAGDLLEYNYCSTADIRRIDRKFREIANVHVCISPGNHDPAVADALYNTYGWSSNVHIFREEKIEKIKFDDINTVVWGLGWNRGEIREPLLERFYAADDDCINILLLHCDVTAGEKSSIYLPVSTEQLANSGVHYAALGHIHKKGEITHKGRIVGRYCGSPEPLDFGETGQHGVYTGEVSRDMCWMQFKPVAKRQFVNKTIQVNPSLTVDEIAEAIRENVNLEGANNLFRFKLAGSLDREIELDTHYLMENTGAFYASVEDNTHPDYDMESMVQSGANGIRSKFSARMLDRIGNELNTGRKAVLERALYMGLDALNGRKVIIK